MLLSSMGEQGVGVNSFPRRPAKWCRQTAGQVEQVIMNLAMNARRGHAHGGKAHAGAANVSFDQDSVGPNVRDPASQ